MTEAEWMVSKDVTAMIAQVHGRMSDRKLRLFVVVCYRRLWHLLPDISVRQAIETVEQEAEGTVDPRHSERDVSFDSKPACPICGHPMKLHWPPRGPFLSCGKYPPCRGTWPFWNERFYAPGRIPGIEEWQADYGHQCRLFRDIIGNPFRPVALDPSWLTWKDGAVRKMAQVIYDDRRFADLPILADALEDAGCTDAAVLAHCRDGGEHVRGCWVVDLLLGKK